MSRKMTYRLIEMMDEGLVDPETIAHCALMYMSEDEVAEMMHCNEIDPEIIGETLHVLLKYQTDIAKARKELGVDGGPSIGPKRG